MEKAEKELIDAIRGIVRELKQEIKKEIIVELITAEVNAQVNARAIVTNSCTPADIEHAEEYMKKWGIKPLDVDAMQTPPNPEVIEYYDPTVRRWMRWVTEKQQNSQ